MEIKNNMNRLDPHLNRLQMEKTQERALAEKTGTAPASGDTVQISSPGLKAAIMESALAAPDVRESKVAAIKASLADGSYEVNASQIAAKLLETERDIY